MRLGALLGIGALTATVLLPACDKPDVEETDGGMSADDGSITPEGDEVNLTGTVRSAITASTGSLQVVALSMTRGVTKAPINPDGSFILPVKKSSVYSLNIQDVNTNNYIASFLYRTGANVSLSLNVGAGDVDLGVCELLDGEVFCSNGFFDSQIGGGSVSPAADFQGAVHTTVGQIGADGPLIDRIFGGAQFDVEIQANPLNPYNVALWNKTKDACNLALVGTEEANGNERYLYTQKVYVTDTCQATARFQASCTQGTPNGCTGFLRMDITSTGSDCAAYPPTHVSHPATFQVTTPGAATCTLPQTCKAPTDCTSGVCDPDSGFCRTTERAAPLRIYSLDVSQGDATLIVTPKGGAVLVDGGRTASGRLVAALVRRLAGHLDYTIATHFDGDHVSGLSPIVRGPDGAPGKKGFDDNGNGTVDEDAEIGSAGSDDLLPIQASLDRGLVPTAANMDIYSTSMGAKRRAAQAGEQLVLPDADVKMTIVTANGVVANGPTFPLVDENDRSVGLLIEYGNFTYLTMGDLPGGGNGQRRIEQAVASTLAGKLPLDVLHLSHHGSGNSSQTDFLAAVSPTVAVASAGDSETCGPGYNTYGLPAQAVLDNLRNTPSIQYVYQTEEGGASFSGNCVVDAGQIYPRNYGTLKMQTSYATLGLEAWPNTFRLFSLSFDHHYDATKSTPPTSVPTVVH